MKRIGTFLILLLALLGLRPAARAQSCAAPTNVRVSSSGSPGNTSAVVSFTPSATALSYTVVYFWSGDTTAAGQMSVNAPGSPVTLTNLRTGSRDFYAVRVLSNCAGGSTAASPRVVFQVGGSGGPSSCAAPTNVVATPLSSGGISLGFTPVAGAVGYLIRYYPATDTAQVRTLTATGSPVSLSAGILPGVTYIIRISTSCGGGAASSAVTVSATGGGTPACNPPSGFFAGTTTTTTASFPFILDATYLSYVVSYYPAGTPPANAQVRTVTTSPVVLTGLVPNTVYIATIRANCAAGGSSGTLSTTFSTRAVAVACGMVSNVVVTGTSASTATVGFVPGAGNIGFTVTCFVRGDSLRTVQTVSGPAAPLVLTGLVAGLTYTIRVTSTCGTGAIVAYITNAPVTYSFRGALATGAALGTGQLRVFPNPAHRAVGLVLPAVTGAVQARLVLLNALGQTVRTQAVPLAPAGDTRAQLDLAGVAPGFYTLRVVAGGQAASQRLVVE